LDAPEYIRTITQGLLRSNHGTFPGRDNLSPLPLPFEALTLNNPGGYFVSERKRKLQVGVMVIAACRPVVGKQMLQSSMQCTVYSVVASSNRIHIMDHLGVCSREFECK